jgi:chaperonin GroEL
MLEDIAVLTRGHLISEDLGTKLDSVTLADLGEAQRVVITKDSTTIIGGMGEQSAVADRCNELRRQIKDTTSQYDKEKLQERLAKLAGGVALIRVGAVSEAELKRLKEAFDDAISSTKAAVAEGIVPGGGAALVRTIDAIDAEEEKATGAERVGIHIVRMAVEVPARTIARNAGVDDGPVIERLRDGTGFHGFDARTRTFGDLDSLGIIDPTKVVRVALENAVSVASVLLLVEATMTEVEEREPVPATNPAFE